MNFCSRRAERARLGAGVEDEEEEEQGGSEPNDSKGDDGSD